ncbi:MAG: hypothetical protein IKG42_00440 [Clostridia bacterium]|nr:hypothetical protein [Clostridia bacterium]
MKTALKKILSEQLKAFKLANENDVEMIIRRNMLMTLMDFIRDNFIFDDVPAIAMDVKQELKSFTFSKKDAIEKLDELEGIINNIF